MIGEANAGDLFLYDGEADYYLGQQRGERGPGRGANGRIYRWPIDYSIGPALDWISAQLRKA